MSQLATKGLAVKLEPLFSKDGVCTVTFQRIALLVQTIDSSSPLPTLGAILKDVEGKLQLDVTKLQHGMELTFQDLCRSDTGFQKSMKNQKATTMKNKGRAEQHVHAEIWKDVHKNEATQCCGAFQSST